jgi:hypothetical protein
MSPFSVYHLYYPQYMYLASKLSLLNSFLILLEVQTHARWITLRMNVVEWLARIWRRYTRYS